MEDNKIDLAAPTNGNLSLDSGEIKREKLAKASAAKLKKFGGDPYGEYANLAEYTQANGRPTADIIEHFQRRALRDQVASLEAGFARSDERNDGAVAQDHELDTLAGGFNQIDARLTQGAARVGGQLASAPFTVAGARALAKVDDKARGILEKERQYNERNTALQTAKDDLSRRYLKGEVPAGEYAAQVTAFDTAQKELVAPTEEELAYVEQKSERDAIQKVQGPDGGSIIEVPEAARASFRELYGEAFSNQEVADWLSEGFNENDYIESLKANSLPRDLLAADVAESYAKEEKTIEAANAKWEEGDKAGAIKQALPAIGRLMKDSVVNLADNPLATFEFVAENAPQYAAGAVRGGLALTNAAYGADVYREAIESYQAGNDGALPTQEEQTQIALASVGAMAAEQLSDLAVLKGLPLGKVSAPVKKAIEGIENNVTRRVVKSTAAVTTAAGRTVQGGVGEFVAEGTQTILEEDVSKLKDVESFAEAYFGATVGLGAGGTTSAVTEAGGVAAKAAKAGAERVLENDRKAEALKAKQQEQKKKIQVAGLTGDFESIEKENEHYDPVYHGQALAFHIENGPIQRDAEGKVVVDEEGKPQHTPLAPERKQALTKELESLVEQQRAKVETLQENPQGNAKAIGVASGQLKALQQQRDAILQQETATAEEVTETVEAVRSGEEVAPEQTERVFGSMRLNPGSVSLEEAQSLLSAPNLTEPQQAEIQSYIEVEEGIEELVKTAGERKVRSDVLQGSRDGQFLGIRNYQDKITSALRTGDAESATKALKLLHNFANHQRKKALVLGKMAARQELSEQEQQFVEENKLKGYRPRTKAGEAAVSRVAELVRQEEALLTKALRQGQSQLANSTTQAESVTPEPSAAAPAAEAEAPSAQEVPRQEEAPAAEENNESAETPATAEATTSVEAPVEIYRTPTGGFRAVQGEQVLGEVEAQEEGTETVVDVAQEARGKGVGRQLLKAYLKQNPFAPSGGFTPAGRANRLSALRALREEEQNPTGELKEALEMSEEEYLARVNPENKEGDPDDYIAREIEDFDLPEGSAPVQAEVASDPAATATTEGDPAPEPEAGPNFVSQLFDRLKERAGKPDLKGLAGEARAKALFAGNWITQFFRPGKAQHLLQTQESVFEGYLLPLLKADYAGESADWGPIETLLGSEINSEQRATLRHLAKFYRQFRRELDTNLAFPSGQYGYSNMLSYLTEENGQLPENVVAAMAISAYNWLANGAQETAQNDMQSIQNILGLKSDEIPHASAFELLKIVGAERKGIARTLGAEIRKMVGLRAGPNAPENAQGRLEAAMGGAVVSTLTRMKMLERTNIAKKDLKAVYEASKSSENESVVPEDLQEGGDGIVRFVRIAADLDEESGYQRPLPQTAAFKETAGNPSSRKLLEALFGSRGNTTRPKLEQPKPRTNRVMQNTSRKVPTAANEKMNIHESRKHTLDQNMVEVVELLDPEQLESIAGLQDPKKAHKVNRASVEGKNLGIKRQLEHLQEFIAELRATPEGLGKTFYYTHNFWKQMRMGMAANTVTPQASKIHRHLVNMEGYEAEIDPKNPEDVRDFMVAIAEALGIDVDKPSEQAGLRDLRKLLDTDTDIQAALATLAKQFTGETIEAADKAAITQAAATHGGFAGLDALVNLARFYDAKEEGKTFTSTIPREVDGVTNGVILGTLQMAAAATSRELGKLLRKGGFLFKNDPAQLSDWRGKATNLDTYEEILPLWVARLANTANTAQKQAVGLLVGQMLDQDGSLLPDAFKKGRKRTKQPLMVLFYGSGKKAVLAKFVDEVMDTIYARVEAAAAAGDRSALRQLNAEIAQATGINKDAFPLTSGKEALESELDYRTERALRKAIESTYGKALVESILEKAEAFSSNRAKVNEAMQTMYEMLLIRRNALIEQAREKLVAEGKMRRGVADLPRDVMQEINESLLDTTPGLRSFFANTSELDTHLDLGKSKKTAKMQAESGKILDNQYVNQELAFKLDGKSSKKDLAEGGIYSGVQREPDEPGVGPLIMAIHSLDAAIMLNALAEMPIMNIHDAGITGVKNARRMGEVLNQSTFEVMRNYSIIGEAANGLERALAGFREFVGGSPQHKLLINQAAAQLTALQKLAEKSDAKKNEVLDNVRIVQQYFIQDGGFQPGQVQLGEKVGETVVEAVTAEKTGQQQAKEALDGQHENTEPALGSAGNSADVDLDSLRSQPEQLIAQEDLLSVFKRVAGMGTVRENATHAEYLRSVLERVQSRMVRPFKLRIAAGGLNENMGVLSGDEMFLLYQTFGGTPPVSGMMVNGVRMSMQEVMAHETIHHIFHRLLDLDNTSTRQLEKLWRLAKKHVKPTDLMTNPNDTSNLDTLAAAQKRWDYMFRPQTNNADGTANYLQEFATFALTNENFRKRLEQIPAQERKAVIDRNTFVAAWESGNLQELLVEILQRLMDIVTSTFTRTRGKSVQKAVDQLMFDMLAHEGRRKHSVLAYIDKANTAVNSVIEPAVNLVKQGALAAARSSAARNSRVPGAKTVGGLLRIANNNRPEALTELLAKARDDIMGNQYGFWQTLATEFQGQTADNKFAHDLVRMANATIDQQRQHINDVFRQSALEAFVAGEPTEAEREAITKAALKTDLSSLLEELGMEGIKAILEDKKVLQRTLQETLDQLQAVAGGNYHYYRRAARALGIHMATGHVVEQNLAMNATMISTLAGTGLAAPANAAQMVPLLDKLATLTALAYTEDHHRTAFSELLAREEAESPGNNGISQLFSMHKVLKEEALQTLFDGKPQLFMKGYIKEIYNPHIGIKVALESDRELMAQQGYKITDYPLGKDSTDQDRAEKYLYVSPSGGMNSYMGQAFSLTSVKARGTTMETVVYQTTVDPETNETVRIPVANAKQQILQMKQRAAREMFEDRTPEYKPGSMPKYAAPLFNERGEVKEFRYLMTEEVKDDLLDKLNLFDEILGGMAGSVVDRPASRRNNQKIIEVLKAQYDADLRKGNTSQYVEISNTSSDERLREVYRMFPREDREVLRKVWRGNKMLVRKDVVDTLFGYRKASVAELFDMDPADQNQLQKVAASILIAVTGGKTYRAATVEKAIRELVREGKDIIVVRTGLVTLGNMISNAMYLRGRGVKTSRAMRDMFTALRGAINYQKHRNERDKLRLKLRTGQDKARHDEYRQQIAILEDKLAKNPVTPLMKEGVMQAIVEDVELDQDRFSYKSRLAEKTQHLTDKIPAPIRGVLKYAYVSQDTQLYKVLNNAVRLSDFVARYALYQDQRRQGVAHGDAVSHVVEKFINFDIPTHRLIQWANDHGLLWFTKYGIRIQKVVYEMFRDNPTEALKLLMLESLVGEIDDIGDALWGFQANPLDKLGTPLRVIDSMDDIATLNLLL